MAEKSTRLRVVKPGESAPEPPRQLSLAEAVELGDYLQILVAQRREIAQSLPEEKGPAKAALHRQLSLIAKEIEALQSRDSDETEGGANVEDGKFDAKAI